MKNVAITGGAGFIGSHLVRKLLERKYEVIVIDNLSTGSKSNIHKKAEFKKIDIRDFGALKQAMKGVDYVFHLAALPRIQRSIQNPLETNEVNVQGTLNVLEAARVNKIKRVIFTSSSSVYGNQKKMPLTEGMVPKPLSPYALQKLIGEKYCQIHTDLYGLETLSLRLFSVYGPGQNGQDEFATVIGKFLYLKKRGKPLIIYGDGEKTRDFTHIDDITDALIRSMEIELPKERIINICTGKAHSINQIARLIGGRIVYKQKRLGESQNIQGSNEQAKKILNWKPQKRLENYLKAIHE